MAKPPQPALDLDQFLTEFHPDDRPIIIAYITAPHYHPHEKGVCKHCSTIFDRIARNQSDYCQRHCYLKDHPEY